MTTANVTQDSVEILMQVTPINLLATQVSAEVLRPESDMIASELVTQDSAESLQGGLVRLEQVTQVSCEILLNVVPIITTTFNPKLLLDVLTHKGPTPWSTFSDFPQVKGVPAGIITMKEVEMISPVTGEVIIGVLMACTDGNVYQLFAGPQDGSVFATAVTWPLPDLTQLPVELRDTIKTFRELWVEGEDISNFNISWSTDGKKLDDPTKVFSPPRRLQNRTVIGANGRQIVFMFTHETESDTTPLLSYMKLNYDIIQQAAGSQGAGQNY